MSGENDDRAVPRREQGAYDYDWAASLAYWREYPAEQFDRALRDEVSNCVRQISSTLDEWRAAVGGDPTAAVKLALRMRMPAEISARLDVTMTTLLAVAFDDAGAALVMAHLAAPQVQACSPSHGLSALAEGAFHGLAGLSGLLPRFTPGGLIGKN
jgi:hypothetical protein